MGQDWIPDIVDVTDVGATNVRGLNLPDVTGARGGGTFRRQTKELHVVTGSTTLQAIGLSAPTLEGTLVSQRGANGDSVQCKPGVSDGDTAGLRCHMVTRRQYRPNVTFTFSSAYLNSRLFIGLTNGAVTGNATTTYTNISVDGAANTFTRSASSPNFVNDGWRPGMTIQWQGFANGGNNSAYVIDTVAAGVITVLDPGGTLVTEGASAAVYTLPSSSEPENATVATTDPSTIVDLSTVDARCIGAMYDVYVDNAATGTSLSTINAITVDAAAKTYTRNDVGGDFIEDGWRVGMRPWWLGFTDPLNNGRKTITGLTDVEMEVAETCADEVGATTGYTKPNAAPYWHGVAYDAITQQETTSDVGVGSAGDLHTIRVMNTTGNVWRVDAYDYDADAWRKIAEFTLTTNPAAAINLAAVCKIIQIDGGNQRALNFYGLRSQ